MALLNAVHLAELLDEVAFKVPALGPHVLRLAWISY